MGPPYSRMLSTCMRDISQEVRSNKNSMRDLAQAYVRYMTGGAEVDAWAAEELSELTRDNPGLAWKEIQRINSLPVADEEWRQHIYAAIGCGPLEDLLVVHEAVMLPIVIEAAKHDAVLRFELSTIYERSVSPTIWAAIQLVAAPQGAAGDVRNARA